MMMGCPGWLAEFGKDGRESLQRHAAGESGGRLQWIKGSQDIVNKHKGKHLLLKKK